MRAQFVLSEVGVGLRRNLTMTFAVVVTVTISLLLLGFGLLVREQIATMKGFWYDRVEVSVFLCLEGDTEPSCADGAVTEAQRTDIESTLRALPQVDEVFYESQEAAYERFQEQFRNNPDLVENVTQDFLPESFRVKLVDPEEFAVVQEAVEGTPGVESVQDQKEILQKFFSVLDLMRNFALGIAIFQAAAATLLIANTIRVAAFSRRRETGIMRLVGASNFYIQLPFLLEAIVAALVGAVIASGLLVMLESVFMPEIRSSFGAAFAFIGSEEVWAIIPWLFATAILISGLAAFVTLRRYLRV